MGVLEKLTRTNNVVELATEYRPAEAAKYSRSRALTAASKRINLSSEEDVQEMIDRPYVTWQKEAWDYHDAIGEINYAHERLAAVMTRLRLYAGLVVDPDAPPASANQMRRREVSQSAEEKERDVETGLDIPKDLTDEVMDFMDLAVAELGSGLGGISGLLRMFVLNSLVPGEMYLAKIDNRWSIRSTSEVTIRQGDRVPMLKESRITRSPNGQPRLLPKDTFIARIWRPHPQWSKEPTSAMIALREPCDELLTLQRMIRSIARSRMNAGILFIPDGLSVAGASVNEDMEDAENETEVLIDELFDTITAPITDETAGTSAVPLVVSGPTELGGEIKHILLGRESDRFLVERADKVLVRILNGLNAPKEIVTGYDEVQYSNANQVTEDLYADHLEPMAIMLCDALTSTYLRARVKARFDSLSEETLAKIVVWYDPTEIAIKVDASESATEGYKNYTLSGDAWRRAHGFADTDAPSQQEIGLRMVVERAGTNLPPETQAQILQQALPQLFGENGISVVPSESAPKDKKLGPDDAITSPNGDRPKEPVDDVAMTT